MGAFGLVLSLFAAGISAAQKSSAARHQEKLAKEQTKLQQKIEVAKARREARIRAATAQANFAAAGISGSPVEGTVTGIQSSLSGGLETLYNQISLQLQEIGLQGKYQRQQALSEFVGSVGSAFSSAYQQGAFKKGT